MPFARLIGRYVAAFLIAGAVIAGAQYLKGHSAHAAATQGLLWGAISSTIYILSYHINTRKAAACPLPSDPRDAGE